MASATIHNNTSHSSPDECIPSANPAKHSLTLLTPHAKPRPFSISAARKTHIPLLDSLATDPNVATTTHILLLGDAHLSPLRGPLERHFASRASEGRASDGRDTEAIESARNTGVKVADLTCPNERIEGLAARLVDNDGAMLRAMHQLCKAVQRDDAGHVLIVLHTGAANLDPTSPSAPLKPRSISAFYAVLRALAYLPAEMLVTGMLPHAAVSAPALRAADDALRRVAGKAYRSVSSELPVAFAATPLALSAADVTREGLSARAVDAWTYQIGHGAEVLCGLEIGLDDQAAVMRDLRIELCGTTARSPESKSAANDEDCEATEKTCPYPSMRPAQDVFARITHDAERFSPEDVIVGYEDRHEGLLEIPFGEWHRESTHEDFVPLHRVRFFRVQGGNVLWDRRRRIDRVFGGKAS